MMPFVGPILILVSLVLLDWLPLRVSFGFGNDRTALPVGIIALAIVLGLSSVQSLIDKIQIWQSRVRMVTAIIILLIGLWLTLWTSFGMARIFT